MSQDTFSYGFKSALGRPGLVGLLYGAQLVLAFIVAVPLYLALGNTVAVSGFSAELAQQFDIALWMDIMEDALPTFQALQLQLLWIVPVFLLWKVASSVGLIHTLQTEGVRGFWQGVGENTGRATLLALVFIVPLLVVLIGIAILVFLLGLLFPGEVGSFWIYAVVLPTLVIGGLSLLDLMHDYARMELVIRRNQVMESMLAGMAWPFRHAGSIGLYIGWFILAGVALVAPTLIDIRPGGLWGVFLIQQVFLFARAGITVGWFGSEVEFYNQAKLATLPLIAMDDSAESSLGSIVESAV